MEARSFSVALEEAKQAYLLGENASAIRALTELVARLDGGEEVTQQVEAEARIYLGEAQLLVQGDNFAAFTTFEKLLERYPEQNISAFEHPTEVVDLFETARREVQARLAAAAVPPPELPDPPPFVPPPQPLWGYLPLGVPQLAQRQYASGITLGIVQLGLAAGSIALFADMLASPGGLAGPPGDVDGSQDERSFEAKRIAQLSMSAGFYATWALSWGLGRNTWVRRARETHAAQATVGLTLDPDGRATLVVGARF